MRALDKGGTLAVAGIHLSDVPAVVYADELFREKQLRSVTANTNADGEEFLRLAATLGIRPTAEVRPSTRRTGRSPTSPGTGSPAPPSSCPDRPMPAISPAPRGPPSSACRRPRCAGGPKDGWIVVAHAPTPTPTYRRRPDHPRAHPDSATSAPR
jgi:hypothetical protein